MGRGPNPKVAYRPSRILSPAGRLTAGGSDEWSTPDEIFVPLDQEFRFGLDVCASAANHKVAAFYDESTDGLKQDWFHTLAGMRPIDVAGRMPAAWCNPPYSDIAPWAEKALNEARRGVTTVILLPNATDTKWFWDYCLQASEIRFIKGRVNFIRDDGTPAPGNTRGSIVVIFRAWAGTNSYFIPPKINWGLEPFYCFEYSVKRG